MTVSKTPVNKHDIVSNIQLSVEVYQVRLVSVNFRKFLRPTTQPKQTQGSTQPMNNSGLWPGPPRHLNPALKILYQNGQL